MLQQVQIGSYLPLVIYSNMNYPKKLVRSIYKTAPEEILEIVTSDETGETINTLGKRYDLTQEQIPLLTYEITLYLIGLTPKPEFKSSLIESIKISEEVAQSLISSLESSVFTKIPQETLNAQMESAQIKLKSFPPEENPSSTNEIEIPPNILPIAIKEEIAQTPITLPQVTSAIEKSIPIVHELNPDISLRPENQFFYSKPEPLKTLETNSETKKISADKVIQPIHQFEDKYEQLVKPEISQEKVANSSLEKTEPIKTIKEEMAHEVKKVAEAPVTPGQQRYAGGVDPYREPIE